MIVKIKWSKREYFFPYCFFRKLFYRYFYIKVNLNKLVNSCSYIHDLKFLKKENQVVQDLLLSEVMSV